MALGQLVRRVLGDRFQPVGEKYRAIFVDLGKVVEAMSRAISPGARCLDVGGGDGMVCDRLLAMRPDIHITMTDIASDIGGFIASHHSARVERRPRTTLADIAAAPAPFDAVLVADVIHHVPESARAAFLRDLAGVCSRCGSTVLVIKDIEPGSLRSVLSVLSDKFVTGDRAVSLIASAELQARIVETFGRQRIASLEVTHPDPPNYCMAIRLQA